MQQAGQAGAEGGKDRARELYYTAAKTYPTSKEPWLKLAEGYFEAGNYGQAILAAQEVQQRDPADGVATSVLAVSGLRVSASALSTLRQQQNTLNGGARSEAQEVAHILRDMLGENVLVPQPTVAEAPPAPRRVKLIKAIKAPAGDVAPPPQKSEPSANPFDALKKK